MPSRTEAQFFWDNQRRVYGEEVPRNRSARKRWAKMKARGIRGWLLDHDIDRMRAAGKGMLTLSIPPLEIPNASP